MSLSTGDALRHPIHLPCRLRRGQLGGLSPAWSALETATAAMVAPLVRAFGTGAASSGSTLAVWGTTIRRSTLPLRTGAQD
jgi:hypothetical protein